MKLVSFINHVLGDFHMRISISIGSAYYNGEEWDSLVDYTMAADRMGVNEAWSAEAWGMDAIVPLAFLAAKTENIRLGTGIMQIDPATLPNPEAHMELYLLLQHPIDEDGASTEFVTGQQVDCREWSGKLATL